MTTAANVVVFVVALLHVYFLVLEMFLWDKPAGLKAFGQTPESAAASKVLAANQGLYNGFLAAGLVWGLVLGGAGTPVKVFFLACVLVAGLYGAGTASRSLVDHLRQGAPPSPHASETRAVLHGPAVDLAAEAGPLLLQSITLRRALSSRRAFSAVATPAVL